MVLIHRNEDTARLENTGEHLDCEGLIRAFVWSSVLSTPEMAFGSREVWPVCGGLCRWYYAVTLGRPGLIPVVHFWSLLIGNLEGIENQRSIRWRLADTLALREFVRIGITEATPTHSSRR